MKTRSDLASKKIYDGDLIIRRICEVNVCV